MGVGSEWLLDRVMKEYNVATSDHRGRGLKLIRLDARAPVTRIDGP
jgi:hypothetical protein